MSGYDSWSDDGDEREREHLGPYASSTPPEAVVPVPPRKLSSTSAGTRSFRGEGSASFGQAANVPRKLIVSSKRTNSGNRLDVSSKTKADSFGQAAEERRNVTISSKKKYADVSSMPSKPEMQLNAFYTNTGPKNSPPPASPSPMNAGYSRSPAQANSLPGHLVMRDRNSPGNHKKLTLSAILTNPFGAARDSIATFAPNSRTSTSTQAVPRQMEETKEIEALDIELDYLKAKPGVGATLKRGVKNGLNTFMAKGKAENSDELGNTSAGNHMMTSSAKKSNKKKYSSLGTSGPLPAPAGGSSRHLLLVGLLALLLIGIGFAGGFVTGQLMTEDCPDEDLATNVTNTSST